jgi:signal transduction histidine kinase
MNAKLKREIRRSRSTFIIGSLALLLAFIGLSIVWNHSIKEELADQAATFVRKGMITTDMRGATEALNGIQLSSFDSVTLFHPTGERVVTLPPIFDYRLQNESFFRAIQMGEISRDIVIDSSSKELIGRIEFSYYRFELVRFAFLIWVFGALGLWTLLHPSIKKVQIEIQNEIRMRNAETVEEVAKKIRHNIRSPIAVLNALFIEQSIQKDEFLHQGIGAVRRLEEIVSEIHSDLKGEKNSLRQQPAVYDLSKAVSSVAAEKRLISKNIPISLACIPAGEPIYSEIPSAELKASLSNLIDNSLQAFDGRGGVDIAIESDEHAITLTISDCGRGIPEEVVHSVFDKGFTFGKSGGTGLGLYYAKRLVEQFQGNIEIRSRVGEGTSVIIIIPKRQTPSWHVHAIEESRFQRIVVCDDVDGILKAWEIRLKSLNWSLKTQFYRNTAQIPLDDPRTTLFLLDYDLGAGVETGLQFMQRTGIGPSAILVTGHFDAPEVQAACADLGCGLLPKDEIATVLFV